MDIKVSIINEIDSRLERLDEHKDDVKQESDNPYSEVTHALSKVIGYALAGELRSIKEYVEKLS
ncbi:MAG: hypothetical protein IKC41_03730 [Clostridia bacterium]|nr:hypothetical protein [Clostridia bacterium]MBR2878465.1 hypothetical protein [Clostridia bacterium]MBR2973306.1 hypothetical protein [Clostridia bacterium]